MTYRLKRGDHVRVRLEGSADEWTPAIVALASEAEPSSVALILGGPMRSGSGGVWMGALPVTVDYERETVISLIGDAYDIEVAG